ncbi:MAG: hypothetical protein SFV51_16070, partial [Bryobacteraceae bacterium]|nr:hypothetical protein [Bryobacteraceae bacterium]
MQIRFTTGISLLLSQAVLAVLLLQPAAAQQPQWKDTAEYELVVNGVGKETNPQKRLQLLQQWEEKYPDSAFKNNRNQAMLQTAQQAGDAALMKKAAQKLAADDPSGVFGLIGYQSLNLLTVSMNDKSEAALADGEKAAKGLLGVIEQVKKPDQVAEDAWAKEKANNQVLAHRALGWIEWQRKNFTGAEGHFVDALKINPNNGEISGWLGTVILLQRNPDKQAFGLYHFARAASLEGP